MILINELLKEEKCIYFYVNEDNKNEFLHYCVENHLFWGNSKELIKENDEEIISSYMKICSDKTVYPAIYNWIGAFTINNCCLYDFSMLIKDIIIYQRRWIYDLSNVKEADFSKVKFSHSPNQVIIPKVNDYDSIKQLNLNDDCRIYYLGKEKFASNVFPYIGNDWKQEIDVQGWKYVNGQVKIVEEYHYYPCFVFSRHIIPFEIKCIDPSSIIYYKHGDCVVCIHSAEFRVKMERYFTYNNIPFQIVDKYDEEGLVKYKGSGAEALEAYKQVKKEMFDYVSSSI